MSSSGGANLVGFTVRRHRGVVRSTFSAELNGLVDPIEQLLLLQVSLRQVYCGIAQSPEIIVDLSEIDKLYPPLDLGVDPRAVYDAIVASDVCEPAGSSFKLHLISVRHRFGQDST